MVDSVKNESETKRCAFAFSDSSMMPINPANKADTTPTVMISLGTNSDDCFATYTLPFPMVVGCANYNSIVVGGNGFASTTTVGLQTAEWTNTQTRDNMMMVLWDDWNTLPTLLIIMVR